MKEYGSNTHIMTTLSLPFVDVSIRIIHNFIDLKTGTLLDWKLLPTTKNGKQEFLDEFKTTCPYNIPTLSKKYTVNLKGIVETPSFVLPETALNIYFKNMVSQGNLGVVLKDWVGDLLRAEL